MSNEIVGSGLVREKIRNSCLEKYGVDSILKAAMIREKQAKDEKHSRYDLFCEQLKRKQLELLDSKEEFANGNIFRYRCARCNEEFKSTHSSIQYVNCPNCGYAASSKEQDLFFWLLSLGIDCVQSDKTQIAPLELDMFIPEHKLAIEFDDLYLHSELFKDKNYHLNKSVKCYKKWIKLLHIFENDWDNRQDIVKSIIKANLGIYDRKIKSKNCKIKEISSSDYKKFVESNSITEYVPAKYKIGLFYEKELIYVCSFGNKENETELVINCSKLNTLVEDGMKTIVKYFVEKYKPETLVYYIDRKYFNDKDFKDWKLVSDIDADYWYFKDGCLENKSKYQKHKLSKLLEKYSSKKSEEENMYYNRLCESMGRTVNKNYHTRNKSWTSYTWI